MERISYFEFEDFIKKYCKECVELGDEEGMMTEEEVKENIISNVKLILE